jgi:flavin reductase (DIM6/NTAB) family NADH-FMN oxidoreductase RutF
MFSSSPPVVIFSPARRLRNNTTKHTLENILEVPEVVISIVTYDIVQQTSLASCEYPKGADEFVKAGFTKRKAELVTPPIVNEAKASLECKVKEVKSLGDNAGAGQLVIAEVLCAHIADELLSPERKFLQDKLELVARMGADWYARVTPSSIFRVPKPNVNVGIGIDALPECIRLSTVLTGNHLAQLANVSVAPERRDDFSDERLDAIVYFLRDKEVNIHLYAKELIEEGKVDEAWQVLLAG